MSLDTERANAERTIITHSRIYKQTIIRASGFEQMLWKQRQKSSRLQTKRRTLRQPDFKVLTGIKNLMENLKDAAHKIVGVIILNQAKLEHIEPLQKFYEETHSSIPGSGRDMQVFLKQMSQYSLVAFAILDNSNMTITTIDVLLFKRDYRSRIRIVRIFARSCGKLCFGSVECDQIFTSLDSRAKRNM